MARSFRLYTSAQFEQVKTLVNLAAERSGLPRAERGKLTAFHADLTLTACEGGHRTVGIARHAAVSSRRRMRAEPVAATGYAGIFPGSVEQVHHVRRAVGRYLARCPAADDAVLIVSEIAANAIVHSASRDQFFTVRAELFPGYVWVEAEDLGGPWRIRQSDGRSHGLDVVQALTGPDGWGVETTTDGGRIVWARLDLTAGSDTARHRARHEHDQEHPHDHTDPARCRGKLSGL
jgi:serine/threonine-protein kinase RsbW